MVDLRHGQRQGRAVQCFLRVVPGETQDAASRGGKDRGEATERARRLLGGLRVALRRCPVTAAGGHRDSRAVHEGQVVVAVCIAGKGNGQFGVAARVIPAPQPELGLGEERQRWARGTGRAARR